jgi:hypothetical protein
VSAADEPAALLALISPSSSTNSVRLLEPPENSALALNLEKSGKTTSFQSFQNYLRFLGKNKPLVINDL